MAAIDNVEARGVRGRR